jgi:hypothetical protein
MQTTKGNSGALRSIGSFTRHAVLVFNGAAMLCGQTFSSGSTGADGPLNITAPGVTAFTQTPVGGGNIYNFTTINIAAGSTLRLSGANFPLPLYFLAQGTVTVAGVIDLSGQAGAVPTTTDVLAPQRVGVTVPGAGGYGGGSAAYSGIAGQPGLGPAGGGVFPFGIPSGGFSGNQFLVPLVGGSGGAGGYASGGAGGGALLIASSVSITVSGAIDANGGANLNTPAPYAGGGAGGGIRLVAPSIAGAGTIEAFGGSWAPFGAGGPYAGQDGVVRLEAFNNNFTGGGSSNFYRATPFNLFLPAPTAQPSIIVTSIGGIAVPPNPTGSLTMPDVTLNSNSPLTVNIQATNVPAGATATLYFYTENFLNQTITSTPLAATSTPGVTTATATVTLATGFSKGFVLATWNP